MDFPFRLLKSENPGHPKPETVPGGVGSGAASSLFHSLGTPCSLRSMLGLSVQRQATLPKTGEGLG